MRQQDFNLSKDVNYYFAVFAFAFAFGVGVSTGASSVGSSITTGSSVGLGFPAGASLIGASFEASPFA